MASADDRVAADVDDDDKTVPPTTKRVRCESCRTVVWTRHAWDRATCACGAVTVAGRPNAPRISWSASPGAGWSDVPADDPAEQVPAADANGVAPTWSPNEARRPIGYLRGATRVVGPQARTT